jgi:hypothetical protein
MAFELASARQVLQRTPSALSALVRDLPEEWIRAAEGPETWCVFDVIGHLVHGERTDWIPRARMILEHGTARTFEPFDRFAQFRESEGRSLAQLLDAFAEARAESLAALDALRLTPESLARQGRHPALGVVTLAQLIATWVAHDLDHVIQVSRVMAKRYTEDVGPWREYLRVLK